MKKFKEKKINGKVVLPQEYLKINRYDGIVPAYTVIRTGCKSIVINTYDPMGSQ